MDTNKKIADINFSTDFGIMVEVSRKTLEKYGVLEEYIQHRGGDKFNSEGYDYLCILQAKCIGLIK